jgi:hypothetical protein
VVGVDSSIADPTPGIPHLSRIPTAIPHEALQGGMAATIDTATSTAVASEISDVLNGNATRNGDSLSGSPDGSKLKGGFSQKYKHVTAVHSRPKASCLSHDSHAAPSFLGFRNLMVIVLGTVPYARIWRQ